MTETSIAPDDELSPIGRMIIAALNDPRIKPGDTITIREYEPDEPPPPPMWCGGKGTCCDSDTWAPCGCRCHS